MVLNFIPFLIKQRNGIKVLTRYYWPNYYMYL